MPEVRDNIIKVDTTGVEVSTYQDIIKDAAVNALEHEDRTGDLSVSGWKRKFSDRPFFKAAFWDIKYETMGDGVIHIHIPDSASDELREELVSAARKIEEIGEGKISVVDFDELPVGGGGRGQTERAGFNRGQTQRRKEDIMGHGPPRDGDEEGRMGQVFKPFSHEQADYRAPGDDDFDPSKPRCKDCAHFDNHGNCHIVPDIHPEGYCTMYFADFGGFAKAVGDSTTNELVFIGDGYMPDIDEVAPATQGLAQAIANHMFDNS